MKIQLSYCQLLIRQNCTHRKVSSSCFLPFPYWHALPRLTRNLASIQHCVCFPFQKHLCSYSNSSPLPHTQTHAFAQGDFASSEPNHHHKTFKSALLGSALQTLPCGFSSRLCFHSSSFLSLLYRGLSYHLLDLRVSIYILDREDNSPLPALHRLYCRCMNYLSKTPFTS